MRQNITIIAVICGLFLSSCSTYTGADGRTHVSDGRMCSSGFCDLLIIAALAGVGVAVASH